MGGGHRADAGGGTVRPGYVVALLIFGFLVGGLVCRPDRTGEAAQHRADSLATVVDQLVLADSLRQRAARADADTVAALKARAGWLRDHAAVASKMSDSLMRALRVWADSVVPKRLVIVALAAQDTVIRTQAMHIGALERTIEIERRGRLAADSAVRAWTTVALQLRTELAAAVRRSNRRWGCTAGAGATAGISQYAAGVGFTCGRRFL